MFYLALLFLAILAAIMVLWIDVPRVVETGELLSEEIGELTTAGLSDEEIAFEAKAFRWGQYCGWILLLLWPLFFLEQAYCFLRTAPGESFARRHPYWWLFCAVPPLRLCAHSRAETEQVWLPKLGWRTVDRKLQRQLERMLSVPMIWIALLILPVLGLQFFFKERIVEYPGLRFVLHFGTGLIWFAFAVEFIVMVSVSEKKWDYCKKHWLDLVIIILPLISFLRTLRLLRTTKLLKLGKLQQLSRVVRVYRLRGVAMRALRALMVLEVVHRLLRSTPENRIRKLEQQAREKQRELDELQEEIDRLKQALLVSSSETSPVDRLPNDNSKSDLSPVSAEEAHHG